LNFLSTNIHARSFLSALAVLACATPVYPATSPTPAIHKQIGLGEPWDLQVSPTDDTLLTNGPGGAFLWDATTGEKLRSFLGHFGVTSAAIYSPDGQYAYTAGYDMRIFRWDLSSDLEPELVAMLGSRINAIDVSADGALLVAGTSSGSIEIIDSVSKQITASYEIDPGEKIWSVAFNADGTQVACGGSGETLYAINVSDGSVVFSATDHSGRLYDLEYSPDGTMLASAGGDRSAILWDASSGSLLSTHTHTGLTRSVSFSSDDSLLATANAHGLTIWATIDAPPLYQFKGHGHVPRALRFRSSDDALFSLGLDGVVIRWDSDDGTEVTRFDTMHHIEISTVDASLDGTRLALGYRRYWRTEGGSVRIFDLENESLADLDETQECRSVTFSDSTLLVSTRPKQNDVGIGVYDLSTLDRLARLSNIFQTYEKSKLSHDGSFYVTEDIVSGTIVVAEGRFIDAVSGELIDDPVTGYDKDWSIRESPTGETYLEINEDGTAYLKDSVTNSVLRAFKNHALPIHSAGFVGSGDKAFTASLDGRIAIYDLSVLPPSNLATSVDAESIEINWDSVPNTNGYRVFRSETDNIYSATLVFETTDQLSYQDTSITEGVLYYYWVDALYGNESVSTGFGPPASSGVNVSSTESLSLTNPPSSFANSDQEDRDRYIVELSGPSLGETYTVEELYPSNRQGSPSSISALSQPDTFAQATIDEAHRDFVSRQLGVKNYVNALRGEVSILASDDAKLDLGPKDGHLKISMNAIVMDLTPSEVESLSGHAEVASIHPEIRFEVNSVVDYNDEINAYEAWDLGYTGEGVTVAVIDTGINYTHPDFGGCTTQEFLDRDCEKVIGGWDFVNDDPDPYDDHSHGTQSASVVAANGGVKGVAPDAKLLVYKAGDETGGFGSPTVLLAAEQALLDGADVMTLSAGGGSSSPYGSIQQSLDNVVAQGVIFTVGAGNQGNNGLNSITSFGSAFKGIAVGSYDSRQTNPIRSYSSKGTGFWVFIDNNDIPRWGYYGKPDVVAPGEDICTAYYKTDVNVPECPTGQYGTYSGTSAATPVVAGMAALILQKNPTWTPEQVKSAIRNTATDLNEDYRVQGMGLVNAQAAINLVNPLPIGILRGIIESETGYKVDASIKGPNYGSTGFLVGTCRVFRNERVSQS